MLFISFLIASIQCLPRNAVPEEFHHVYFSTDVACEETHGGYLYTPSMRARRFTWQPLTIYFACYDAKAMIPTILADPDNKRPSVGNGEETLLIDGYKLFCNEEFHVVFIITFSIHGQSVAKGYCMFRTPALEIEFVRTLRQGGRSNRLAQFQALPQPFGPDEFEDINWYNAAVQQHMEGLLTVSRLSRNEDRRASARRARQRGQGSAPAANVAQAAQPASRASTSGTGANIVVASLQRPGSRG